MANMLANGLTVHSRASHIHTGKHRAYRL